MAGNYLEQLVSEWYAKKFAAGRKYIPEIFAGFDLPTEIEQIAC